MIGNSLAILNLNRIFLKLNQLIYRFGRTNPYTRSLLDA